MARTRKTFILGLDPASYNPTGLRAYSDAELLHEYARIRREATERLRSLGRSQWAYTDTYRDNIDKFVPLRQLSGRRELERLVIEGAHFVTSRVTSASGMAAQRDRALESLHASGYTFVTRSNWRSFAAFMGELRAGHIDGLRYKDAGLGSKIPPEELEEAFDTWQDDGEF